MDKDTIKEIAYGLVILTAAIIKHYKDKKDRKKTAEAQTVEMAKIAQRIAEEQREKAEQSAASLREQLDQAARSLSESNARHLAEERRLKDLRSGIELEDRIDREVRHAERKIINAFHVQRMYVIHFSNGTVTEAGIHLMKMTFKSEVFERHDVEPIAKYFQETPVPEMFKSPLRLILMGAQYYVEDLDIDKAVTPEQKEYINWLMAYNVKSVLWLPIRNNGGKIVAIQVMHWFSSTHFTPAEITKIRDMKSEVEGIYNKLTKSRQAPQ